MGSDPDRLYPREEFLKAFKFCGNYAFLTAPSLLSICYADSEDVADLEKISENKETKFVKKFEGNTQQEFNRRVNDVVNDLIELGYYRKIEV